MAVLLRHVADDVEALKIGDLPDVHRGLEVFPGTTRPDTTGLKGATIQMSADVFISQSAIVSDVAKITRSASKLEPLVHLWLMHRYYKPVEQARRK